MRRLWQSWIICFGCPALVTTASLLIPPLYLPLLCILLGYALLLLHRHRLLSTESTTRCSMVQWLTMIAMFVAAVIMTGINIVYSPKVIPSVVAENPELPFITSLVVYPLMCAVSIYGLYVGHDSHCCRRCQAIHGYYTETGRVSKFYFNASRGQLRWILGLSAGISVVDTVYFFTTYINVNLNNPDRFFFIALPVTLYVLSLGYMMSRYYQMYMSAVATQRAEAKARAAGVENISTNGATLVRFLPICGDYLLLQPDREGLWDTPLQHVIPYTNELSDGRAMAIVTKRLPETEFKLKYIFTNEGYVTGCNVFHYAVLIDESDIATALPDCRRCTLDILQRLIREGRLSPYISNELVRIHTITMAWKTYRPDGSRLYPIKNYRPTFRLRDFKDWDVDYNDISWLRIAANNQDKPFWLLRRFINKYLLFGHKHYSK